MNRTTGLVVALTTGGALLLGSGAAVSAEPESARPSTPVTEQNTDADGNIKVHEQGVVDSRVLNLPLDSDGRLRTAGEVDVAGTVGLDPTANTVTLDASTRSTLADLLAELQQLGYDGEGRLLVSGGGSTQATPPIRQRFGTGAAGVDVPATYEHVVGSAEDAPFHATNLTVASTADTWVGLRNQGHDVTMYAVEAGVPLHVELDHPLAINVVFFQCRDAGGAAVACNLRYSVSGFDG